MLQHGPIGLQEAEVSFSGNGIDRSSQVLEGSMDEVKGEGGPRSDDELGGNAGSVLGK